MRAELVSDPVQATSPASPSLRRTAMLALLAGLAIGLAAVYVLDTLDDRFRSVEELQAQIGVPVMAIVQNLPNRHTTGVETLQLVAEPDAPESEAFRTLRTSLALTHDQSRRIVVTSAEPGDGKSTVLANMAVAYANSGKRTLLIDADLRRPGLSTMLGIRGAEGLSTVMRSQQPVGEVVTGNIRQTGVTRLDVLPSGPRPMNPTELLGSQHFCRPARLGGRPIRLHPHRQPSCAGCERHGRHRPVGRWRPDGCATAEESTAHGPSSGRDVCHAQDPADRAGGKSRR